MPIFRGGRYFSDGARQWAPLKESHDPNPPLSLEDVSHPLVKKTQSLNATAPGVISSRRYGSFAGRGGGTSYSLSASQGSYSLAGQASALRAARTIVASSGTYSLAGQGAGLSRGLKVSATQGAYSLAGQAAGLLAARKLTSAQGSYSLSGQASSLRAARKMVAVQGNYSLSGQAVGLNYSAGAKVLAASQGNYSLSGQATILRAARRLFVGQGVYTISGQTVTLTYVSSTPVVYVPGDWPQCRLADRLTVLRLPSRSVAASIPDRRQRVRVPYWE